MAVNSWPEDFLDRMRIRFGNEFDAFAQSLNQPSPVSIRLNPFKHCPIYQEEEKIPWSEFGRYLPERPSFTLDPFFHAGCYYVQEASSQFLEKAFTAIQFETENPVVLDLCAAPGGKSTHLLSLLKGKGVLVSNEVISSRNSILRENLAKWGCANSILTQNEADVFGQLGGLFDLIVVDAPCSGEGLFRRDPDAANEWSVDAVQLCSSRQSKILQDILPALKPGGWMIYSTCTFESSENEEQLELLLQNGMELRELKHDYTGLVNVGNGQAFYPHRAKGEGFFIALLRKKSEDTGIRSYKRTKGVRNVPSADLSDYIDLTGQEVVVSNNRLWLHNETVAAFYRTFSNELVIRSSGVYCGEIGKDGIIPSPELALSIHLLETVPFVEVELPEALSFLRGESAFKTGASAGWNLIRYQEKSLGWIKQLSGRFNNYYPKEWRIRMR